MKKQLAVTILTMTAVLGACRGNEVVAGPAANRLKWGWDKPLATGGGGPVLVCSPTTVSHLGSVTCSFAGGGILNLPFWHFEADGPCCIVLGPGATAQWTGDMVVSGDVVASWVDFDTGLPHQLRKTITVQRRNWSWVTSVGGQAGAPGEIDTCFDPANWFQFGLTARTDCTSTNDAAILFSPVNLSNGTGYVAASIPAGTGNGPNQGLWYVASVSADIHLRTQQTRKMRADGDTVTLAGTGSVTTLVRNGCVAALGNALGRNHRTVNTTCVPTPDFATHSTCTWAHEARHLDSALVSAKRPLNDVHKLFEPVVMDSAYLLDDELFALYNDAHTNVNNSASNAHGSMTWVTFTYYWNKVDGFGWRHDTLSTRCP